MADAAPSPSIAFVVPALNEAGNIERTVRSIESACAGRELRYGIYLFNDGSTDKTPEIADGLAKARPFLHVIHNPRTMGLGYNYFRGVAMASEDYVLMIPGDGEIPEPAIKTLLDQVGKADLIIPSVTGQEARPPGRRVLSRAFVGLNNLLFGLDLRYYNGPCVLKRESVHQAPFQTGGFAYMAALLVWLIKHGYSYKEIAIPLEYRKAGASKALMPKNVASVVWTLARLWWKVHLPSSKDFSAKT